MTTLELLDRLDRKFAHIHDHEARRISAELREIEVERLLMADAKRKQPFWEWILGLKP